MGVNQRYVGVNVEGNIKSHAPVMCASKGRFSERNSRNSSSAQPESTDGGKGDWEDRPTASMADAA